MKSHLGDYFRKTRVSKGITLGQLARQVGYRNVSKGCRRIDIFERTGRSKGDLLSSLATALEIDDKVVQELQAEDRRAWEEWRDAANQPKPYLVVRLLAAIYSEVSLPDGVTTRDEAEAFASQVAAERRMQVCLVWSRKLTIWFDRDGTRIAVRESAFDVDHRPRAWIP